MYVYSYVCMYVFFHLCNFLMCALQFIDEIICSNMECQEMLQARSIENSSKRMHKV
jgi:hypothetical protein